MRFFVVLIGEFWWLPILKLSECNRKIIVNKMWPNNVWHYYIRHSLICEDKEWRNTCLGYDSLNNFEYVVLRELNELYTNFNNNIFFTPHAFLSMRGLELSSAQLKKFIYHIGSWFYLILAYIKLLNLKENCVNVLSTHSVRFT